MHKSKSELRRFYIRKINMALISSENNNHISEILRYLLFGPLNITNSKQVTIDFKMN